MSITEHSKALYDQIVGDPDNMSCRNADPDVFFPEDRKELWKAQSLCSSCPVKDLCLELGVTERRTGVWGGKYIRDGKIKARPFNGAYRQTEEFEQAELRKSA